VETAGITLYLEVVVYLKFFFFEVRTYTRIYEHHNQ